MLRPFQVNIGKFLQLDREVLPTARVSELCVAVEAVSGVEPSEQVLLASDGRQMSPSDHIGAYSITESQPVFVFYRSHLLSPEPPQGHSPLPHRGDLQHQLELLRMKPSPALFQRQVALAKHLSEYSVRVADACCKLSQEYQLQLTGWLTVLSNCHNIIKMYKKHKSLFSKSVEEYNMAKPRFQKLLNEFPAHVRLLQQLPVPKSLQVDQTPTSLYDWISTHDEKNSLQDLGTECQRSLAKVDSGHITATLQASDEILATAEVLLTSEEGFTNKVPQFQAMIEDSAAKIDTLQGLAKNIQSTSERALRSGDAGTIADLVLSHHQSLQMMADLCHQLELAGREIQGSKLSLTAHIHVQLKEVTQLQKGVSDSNNQLVLLHEHVKLARKRFEILDQVCTAPEALVKVLSEVERRRYYNNSLEKKTSEVSQVLKKAREEEKLLRRGFVESHGQHFILTLFPELRERVPDITVHLPKSLSRSSLSAESDLESIRHLLPESMKISSADLNCTSIRLLNVPLSANSTDLTELGLGTESTDSALSSSSRLLTTDTDTQTEIEAQDYDQLAHELDHLKNEILSTRENCEQSQSRLTEEQRRNGELLEGLEAVRREKEALILRSVSQEEQLKEVRNTLSEVQTNNIELQSTVDSLLRETEHLKQVLEDNKEQQRSLLVQSQSDLANQHLREIDSHQVKITELQSVTDDLRAQLENTQQELASERKRFENDKQKFETETSALVNELGQLEQALQTLQTDKDVLTQQKVETDSALNEKELIIERLKEEMVLTSAKLENTHEELQEKIKELLKNEEELTAQLRTTKESGESESKRQESRYSQAQKAINNLKAQLERAQTQVTNSNTISKESLSKLGNVELELVALKEELRKTKNNLSSTEQMLKEEQVKLQEAAKFELKYSEVARQRDQHMTHAMEVERELREFKRDLGISPPSSLVTVESSQASQSAASGGAPKTTAVSQSVEIGNLNMGDVAIFMNDQYGNYLALSLDPRTYYLNHKSVSQLEDFTGTKHKLNLSRKILCGRLTSKVLVEVRKENNRLRVPVGERLYKVDAEPLNI